MWNTRLLRFIQPSSRCQTSTVMDTNTMQRLRQDVPSSDVTLICGRRVFHVHRLILSTASLYFRSIFHANMMETKDKIVIVPAPVTGDALDAILDFMYSSRIRSTDCDTQTLADIVTACSFLKMDEFFAYSLRRLAEYLSVNDVCELSKLVAEYEDTGWASQLASHLLNKLCHIHKRKDFLNLNVKELNVLLKHMKLDDDSTVSFATALLAWLNYDKSRNNDVIKLISVANFELDLTILNNNDRNMSKDKQVLSLNDLHPATESFSEKGKTSFRTQKFLCFRYENGQGIVRFYDIEKDSWSAAKTLPFSLMYESAIVEFEQHVYFFGGSPFPKTGGSSEVTTYCPVSNSSFYENSLIFPVVSASAAVLHGSIYIIGGKNWLNHLFPTRRVQCYNPSTGDCKELDSTYNCNWRCQAFAFEGHVYVVDLDAQSSSIERYDPNTNQWTIVTDRIFNEQHLQSSFLDNKLYLTVDDDDSVFRRYDVVNNIWEMAVHHQRPCTVHRMWAAARKGRSVLLVHCACENFHLFDVESETWEERESSVNFLQNNYGSIVMRSCQEPRDEKEASNHITTTLDFMRKQCICTDVTMMCGGSNRSLHAHQLVLSVAGSFFQSMFSCGFKESVTGVVIFPTITYEIMEHILEFIYTGQIKDIRLNKGALNEILPASHLMNIHSLYHFCMFGLIEDLGINNFLSMFELANTYDQAFASHVVTFIVKHFLHILCQDDFLEMDVTLWKKVLQHPDIQNPSSVKIFVESVLQWVKVDLRRQKRLPKLLSFVHLKHLPLDYLQLLSTHEIVNNNTEALEIISKEIHNQENPENVVHKFTRTQLMSFYDDDDDALRKIVYYDISKNQWNSTEFEASNPLPHEAASVAFGDEVYFFGGNTNEGNDINTLVYKCCLFNHVASVVGTLQFGMTGSGAGVVDDAIYIVGGKNAEGQYLKSVQRFIPSTNECQIVASTSEHFYKPNVFTQNSLLYVLSSMSTSNNVVESYNSLLDQWTVVTKISLVYDQCSSTFCDGKLYLLGMGEQFDPYMSVYDFSRNEWEPFSEIAGRTLRLAFRLLACKKGGKPVIFVFQRDNFFKLYDVANSKWKSRLSTNRNGWDAMVVIPLKGNSN